MFTHKDETSSWVDDPTSVIVLSQRPTHTRRAQVLRDSYPELWDCLWTLLAAGIHPRRGSRSAVRILGPPGNAVVRHLWDYIAVALSQRQFVVGIQGEVGSGWNMCFSVHMSLLHGVASQVFPVHERHIHWFETLKVKEWRCSNNKWRVSHNKKTPSSWQNGDKKETEVMKVEMVLEVQDRHTRECVQVTVPDRQNFWGLAIELDRRNMNEVVVVLGDPTEMKFICIVADVEALHRTQNLALGSFTSFSLVHKRSSTTDYKMETALILRRKETGDCVIVVHTRCYGTNWLYELDVVTGRVYKISKFRDPFYHTSIELYKMNEHQFCLMVRVGNVLTKAVSLYQIWECTRARTRLVKMIEFDKSKDIVVYEAGFLFMFSSSALKVIEVMSGIVVLQILTPEFPAAVKYTKVSSSDANAISNFDDDEWTTGFSFL